MDDTLADAQVRYLVEFGPADSTDGNYNGVKVLRPYLQVVNLDDETVEETFANSTPVEICDARGNNPSTVTSMIDVAAFGTVVDLDVQLDITHTFNDDLNVYLVSPDDTRIKLFGRVGGSSDNFSGTTLDDEAFWAITEGHAPFSYTYRPQEPLSTFDGLEINGTWTLEVEDVVKNDTGTLNWWSMITVYALPAPNGWPTAEAGGPYSGTEDLDVTFDASGSSDPDGDPLTYTWDFGDGETLTTTSATVTHAYQWGDEFTVSLTVDDGNGGSATTTTVATIEEVNDLPVVDPGGPYSELVGESITFDGSASYDYDNVDGTTENDQTLTYAWDFGDGTTGSGEVVSHAYETVGEYTVDLTVNDGMAGVTESTTATVTETSTVEEYTVEGPISIDDAHPVKGEKTTISEQSISSTDTIFALDLVMSLDDGTTVVGDLSATLTNLATGVSTSFARGELTSGPYTYACPEFVNTELNGTWQLAISDWNKGTSHTLNYWSLLVTPVVKTTTSLSTSSVAGTEEGLLLTTSSSLEQDATEPATTTSTTQSTLSSDTEPEGDIAIDALFPPRQLAEPSLHLLVADRLALSAHHERGDDLATDQALDELLAGVEDPDALDDLILALA